MVFGLFLPAAFANSAPVDWSGRTAVGALAETADCPLTVEREDLVFELAEFPQQNRKQDPRDYGGRVTATYRFHNPTNETVTATLAFPFGNTPYYFSFDAANDAELVNAACGVTVNGESVPKTVRYTYSESPDFDASADLPRIRGDVSAAAELTAETPVTLTYYAVSDLPENTDYWILAKTACPALQTGAYLFLLDENGICCSDTRFAGTDASAYTENGETLVFLGINAEPPEATFTFDNAYTGEPLGQGRAALTGRETCTLEDYIAARRPVDSPVSETDWLHAALEMLNGRLSDEEPFDQLDLGFSALKFDLMRWYEYTLTLSPGDTLENAVTAPMYPTADRSQVPTVWSYTYYLSPAAMWADFGELAVEIRTPHTLRACSFANAEQISGGYRLRFDTLPAGELTFSLSRTGQPLTARDVLFFVGLLLVLTAPVFAVVLLLARRKHRRKKT